MDKKYTFQDLIDIMIKLRSDDGCPWDKVQTHQSIRKNFLEETCEVLEAIDNNDPELLKEELGDVLLQVVFHAQMENEVGTFDINDVIHDVCQKLVIRHPHIFSDTVATTSAEVLNNWEKIKRQQKGFQNKTEYLKAVAKTLPALMRAEKVGSRGSKSGFDFECLEDTITSLEDELKELKLAIANADQKNISEEFGDVLLSCVNVSRFLNLDSEECLNKATDKFIDRFEKVEKLSSNADLTKLTQDELNALWDKAKQDVHSVS